jgi:hypothetical protein
MHPNTTLIIGAGSALATLVSLIVSVVALGKARNLARAGHGLEGDFETVTAEVSSDLERLLKRADEQARKIAWLETRARPGRSEQTLVTEVRAVVNAKPTITERRHRVQSLSRRGQNAQSIAHILGMPHGEVELIINLLKAA